MGTIKKEDTIKQIKRLVSIREVDWNDCDLYDKAKSNSDTYLVAILDAIDVVEDMLTVEPKVDKDALIRLIQGTVEDGDDCRRLIEMVDRPQGKWIMSDIQCKEDTDNGNYQYICSVCGHGDIHARTQEVPHCWWCGARMKGADDETL